MAVRVKHLLIQTHGSLILKNVEHLGASVKGDAATHCLTRMELAEDLDHQDNFC